VRLKDTHLVGRKLLIDAATFEVPFQSEYGEVCGKPRTICSSDVTQ
jgi:hypothetical protein